eukprot:1094473-Pelagomonas_calceolata.AAC.4
MQQHTHAQDRCFSSYLAIKRSLGCYQVLGTIRCSHMQQRTHAQDRCFSPYLAIKDGRHHRFGHRQVLNKGS